MKRTFAGVIAGLLIGLAIPANAVKATPKPTITVTATPKPTATFDAQQYLRRYCYGLDMVYVVDNQEFLKLPSQIAVVPNSIACADGTNGNLKASDKGIRIK